MIKIVLNTFIVTTIAFGLALYFFLNPMLNVFGYTSITIKSFNQLNNAHSIVQKMRGNYRSKKLNTAKSFAAKSSKKIASSAAAAATIGTVAVIATVSYFEISDYCNEKKQLQIEENILFEKNIEFDFVQCMRAGREDFRLTINSMKRSPTDSVFSVLTRTNRLSNKVWSDVKSSSFDAYDYVYLSVSEMLDSLRTWANEK